MSTPIVNSLLPFPLIAGEAVGKGSSPAHEAGFVADLTRRLAGGEEAAFREFHARYFDPLYRFLLVVTRGNEHEAQEALQQTMLRVVRYVRRFESEEIFWSWLKTLARSAARDAGRKQQRYSNLIEAFALRLQGSTPHHGFPEENRLLDALEESLEALEPDDRQLLEAKYLNGSTVKELCATNGGTEKAVESRLRRLRLLVRDNILKRLSSS